MKEHQFVAPGYAARFGLQASRDFASLVVLFLLIGALFFQLPTGFWRNDDPAILFHAINAQGLSAFYNPSVWRHLSPSNLTPWLTLSFKLDLWAGGLSPKFFYLHQLAALALVVIAAYTLARQWSTSTWALLFVALFLVGAPTASVTELLMTRHYLEGLLFAILATIGFVYAQRSERLSFAYVGAIFYALACTAKEVYVPLVLVLIALPEKETLIQRLRLTLPYLLVSVAYVFWRHFMLGSIGGGYTGGILTPTIGSILNFGKALALFPRFLFGSYWQLPTAIAAVALVFHFFRRPASTGLALALSASILMPLIPLVRYPGLTGPNRYLFAFWFVSSLVSVMTIRSLVDSSSSARRKAMHGIGIAMIVLIIGFAFAHGRRLEDQRRATYREFDVQGRFIMRADKDIAYIPPPSILSTMWYVTNLCAIKETAGLTCPVPLIKGVPIARHFQHLYRYDPARGAMVGVSADVDKKVKRILFVDTTRPLVANLVLDKGCISWTLGPYRKGQYFAVSPKIGRFPLPHKGTLRIAEREVRLYIQYQSPKGWTTSSPLLLLRQGHPVVWTRKQKHLFPGK